MTSVLDTLKYENPVLRSYIYWSCILIVKMLLMMLLTGFKRILKQVSGKGMLTHDIQSQLFRVVFSVL